jgi:outer membrane autotransporter protein
MSYSFVNTFDYTNAAGVRIDSDPLHAIQLEPGLKFIGNLKNGWQPYVGVSMVWNIMDKTDFTANNVSLPEMSVKPYVKYGVGVRKTWGERLSGFIQAFFTNGGRNGLGLQAGFRFALGKEGAPVKVQNSKPELPKTKVTLSGLK